ncbi:unnamed protein product, partial [Linum tenue]
TKTKNNPTIPTAYPCSTETLTPFPPPLIEDVPSISSIALATISIRLVSRLFPLFFLVNRSFLQPLTEIELTGSS